MNRLLPIILASSLFLGGTALAQTIESPSLSGLAEAITGAVSDALSSTSAEVTESLGSDFGGPGFLDPETGDDDTLSPETGDETGSGETGNDAVRRRPLDLSAVGHEDIQGVVLVCKWPKAGGNPMEGLNLGGNRPKKPSPCKVVSK